MLREVVDGECVGACRCALLSAAGINFQACSFNHSDISPFNKVKLGFHIDFLHGKPPFYGSVSRDRGCLHLRFVHQTNFVELASREGSLILATIEVANVKALFQEYEARSVDFPQRLVRQAWGGLDFHVRDPDGNVISFVQNRGPAPHTEERRE
jgi:hypothetical protein